MPKRLITLTLTELAELVTIGGVFSLALANQAGALNFNLIEQLKQGYIVDLGMKSDEDIKKMYSEYLILLNSAKIQHELKNPKKDE